MIGKRIASACVYKGHRLCILYCTRYSIHLKGKNIYDKYSKNYWILTRCWNGACPYLHMIQVYICMMRWGESEMSKRHTLNNLLYSTYYLLVPLSGTTGYMRVRIKRYMIAFHKYVKSPSSNIGRAFSPKQLFFFLLHEYKNNNQL